MPGTRLMVSRCGLGVSVNQRGQIRGHQTQFLISDMAADTTGTVHKDSSIPSVQDYFDNLAGDMTRVTWAHAVNSQSKLSDALNDDEIMMLEADVILGRLIGGSNEIIPVMGHPPSIESDLSLQNFIESVIEVQGSQKKGIKLDFKSTDVFKGSLKIIDTLRDKVPEIQSVVHVISW